MGHFSPLIRAVVIVFSGNTLGHEVLGPEVDRGANGSQQPAIGVAAQIDGQFGRQIDLLLQHRHLVFFQQHPVAVALFAVHAYFLEGFYPLGQVHVTEFLFLLIIYRCRNPAVLGRFGNDVSVQPTPVGRCGCNILVAVKFGTQPGRHFPVAKHHGKGDG